jgi:hypothetical protein
MPTIKNIGTTPKMVADRYLKPGESRDVTPKQAQLYVGDADLQISDEPKVALLKVQLVQDEQPSAISNWLLKAVLNLQRLFKVNLRANLFDADSRRNMLKLKRKFLFKNGV